MGHGWDALGLREMDSPDNGEKALCAGGHENGDSEGASAGSTCLCQLDRAVSGTEMGAPQRDQIHSPKERSCSGPGKRPVDRASEEGAEDIHCNRECSASF